MLKNETRKNIFLFTLFSKKVIQKNMNDPPKILAFAGSLRKESFNKKLVKIAIEGAKEAGGIITYIDLEDYPLPIYNQEIEDNEGLPENAIKLKTLMKENNGFLISSPEYNSSIPGGFKNMIDWTSRKATPEETYLVCFINKAVALMSASPSDLGGLRGLVTTRSIFTNLYSFVLPRQKCIPKADQAFNELGNLKEPKNQNDIINIGKELVNFIKKIT